MTGKYGRIVEVMAWGSRAVWGYSDAHFFSGCLRKTNILAEFPNEYEFMKYFSLSDYFTSEFTSTPCRAVYLVCGGICLKTVSVSKCYGFGAIFHWIT